MYWKWCITQCLVAGKDIWLVRPGRRSKRSRWRLGSAGVVQGRLGVKITAGNGWERLPLPACHCVFWLLLLLHPQVCFRVISSLTDQQSMWMGSSCSVHCWLLNYSRLFPMWWCALQWCSCICRWLFSIATQGDTMRHMSIDEGGGIPHIHSFFMRNLAMANRPLPFFARTIFWGNGLRLLVCHYLWPFLHLPLVQWCFVGHLLRMDHGEAHK